MAHKKTLSISNRKYKQAQKTIPVGIRDLTLTHRQQQSDVPCIKQIFPECRYINICIIEAGSRISRRPKRAEAHLSDIKVMDTWI
jgi:hypothetical protein